ncbi:unnamed protein product [Linum trigynum]|uniref:Uncharacterized protein n=1 Tax=Linum trigynum TaxID=586398 RepID=A0AAV2DIH0_9ROSI
MMMERWKCNSDRTLKKTEDGHVAGDLRVGRPAACDQTAGGYFQEREREHGSRAIRTAVLVTRGTCVRPRMK